MKNRSFSIICSGAVIALLSGCLGTENADFNQQALDSLQFINQLESLPATGADNMPTGSAEYRGVASFTYDAPLTDANPGTDLFADVTLTADFDTNDVSGSITSFNSPSGNVSGTVDVSSGAIVQDLMQANGAGTVVDDGQSIALEMDISGQFRGDDAEAVTGVITGTYTPEGGSEGDLFGSFAADQN